MDSVESAGGQLGAVLSAPRSGAAALAAGGPWLATSLEQARQVLTDVTKFDFPGNVSRTDDLSGSRGETRSGHTAFPTVTPDQVIQGVTTFDREWSAALHEHDRTRSGEPYDAMVLLRRPVARSTTSATMPSIDEDLRDVVADRVLDWVDALGPVIAAPRPPRRWSRIRRVERDARLALEELLEVVLADRPALGQTAPQVATLLAAGTQVPIAAGAFLLAWLADHPTGAVEPVHAVWETLRLTPPTWLAARVTTREVQLGGTRIPAGGLVFVSPLLLGRLADLVPGDAAGLVRFDPDRWRDGTRRPGAWLPFGAGPHACPGRNLGMAVLTHLAEWAAARDISLAEHVSIDQSRGIAPLPCRFTVTAGREPVL